MKKTQLPLLQALSLQKRVSSVNGFTLTEVLVVIVIAGVLAAIAAPGWLAFMNRQRIQTARTETLQMLREAQKEAITKRASYGVEIQSGANAGDDDILVKLSNKDGQVSNVRAQVISSGDFDVQLSAVPNNNQIFFDFDGSVIQPPDQANNPDGSVYKVVLQTETSGELTGDRNCVIVETLLGSMREASGDDCN